MKPLILSLAFLFAASSAYATRCGAPPAPPAGTTPLCMCDRTGNNCHWVYVSKQSAPMLDAAPAPTKTPKPIIWQPTPVIKNDE